MTKQQEKLKSLMTMLLRWAEINKRAVLRGKYEVPGNWKKAFRYVTRLDNKLESGVMERIPSMHMLKCNKLFREYRC